MRWVVIGSSGYIGSALCRSLVQAGSPVLSVSRRPSAPADCEHRQVEVFDADSFAGMFEADDIVVYAAGLASSADCRKNPTLAEWLNCDLPVQLLKLADSANAAQFLYLSSIKALRAPAGVIATEESGEPANDPYGGGKWRAEQQLLSSPCRTRVNILRPASVYGGSSAPPKRAILLKSPLRAWCKLLPIVPATGYRSVVALDDLVSAIVCVAKSGCRSETFIVAEPVFHNLASISAAVSGRRIKSSEIFTRVALLPTRVLASLGGKSGFLDVARSELYSSARLKTRLNWRPLRRYSQFLGEE